MNAALTSSSFRALRTPLQSAARRTYAASAPAPKPKPEPSVHAEEANPLKDIIKNLTKTQKIVLGSALAVAGAAESAMWYKYFFGKPEETQQDQQQQQQQQ